jgi:hypothetical protein
MESISKKTGVNKLIFWILISLSAITCTDNTQQTVPDNIIPCVDTITVTRDSVVIIPKYRYIKLISEIKHIDTIKVFVTDTSTITIEEWETIEFADTTSIKIDTIYLPCKEKRCGIICKFKNRINKKQHDKI